MPTFALEGQGASIAFGTSTFTSDLLSLTLPEQVRAELETTHLGTLVAKTRKPAKLKDVGTIGCEFDHNPAAANLLAGQPEAIRIYYPLQDGQTTPDRLDFTGFATQQGGEEFKTDAKMTTKVTLRVSGDLVFTHGT